MTLFVDATTGEHARGIGTVIDGLLSEASKVAPEGTIVVTGPGSSANWGLETERIGLARKRAGRILYQRVLLPAHIARLRATGRRIDRVLLLDSYLPLVRPDPRVRYAVLVHDVLPLTHPEYWSPAERAVKRAAFFSLRHSTAQLFTSTEHNAREILRVLGRDAEVVRFGCGQLSDTEADAALVEALPATKDNLVYVGALEQRKDVLFLLDVYEQVRHCGATLQLTLIGRGQDAYKSTIENRVARSDFRRDITIVEGASRLVTLGLMSQARALLLPSKAEGFGLPIVEALALGTAVVARRLPSIMSWADDAVTYAGSTVDEWVEAIVSASETSDLARRSRQSAVRSYRWRSCAQVVLSS